VADRSLVIAAHGSADPRFGATVDAIAALVVAARPDLDVRVGYLEHGEPFESVADAESVVVPLLLTSGYHARQDIPSRFAGTVTAPIGPDRRLIGVLVRRLRDAGWGGERPLVLAAAGSADARALADVHQMARDLGDELGLDVQAAFISAGEPALSDAGAAAVATYLLCPGKFADEAAGCGADVVAAPVGADPLIAEIVLDRFDSAVVREDRD
jgi:sirohydrochlorin ferrochelatase